MIIDIELIIERDEHMEIWVYKCIEKPEFIEQDKSKWTVIDSQYDQELKSTKLSLKELSSRPDINKSITLHY